MSKAEVLVLLDKIAEALVFADPDRLELLAEVADDFRAGAPQLRRSGRPGEAEICSAAASYCEKIAAAGVPFAAGIAELSTTIHTLQACLNNEYTVDEAVFPSALSGAEFAATEAPSLVDEALMSEFVARQADELEIIEKALLAVDGRGVAGDHEVLLRFFHSLKGESGLLGLTEVAEICHAAEDVIQSEPLTACTDRLLEVKDWLQTALKNLAGDGTAAPTLATIMGRLQNAGAAPTPVGVEASEYCGKNLHDGDVELLQEFVDEALENLDEAEGHLLELEQNPHADEALNAIFRTFHTIKGLSGFVELNHVRDLAHKAENLLDLVRSDKLKLVGRSMDLAFASVDMLKRLIEGVTTAMRGDGRLSEEASLPGLMERLVAATTGDPQPPEPEPEPEPEPVPDAAAPPTKGLIFLGKPKPKTVDQPAPPIAKVKVTTKVKEIMRVDADRLDHLTETIGELVIAETMVSKSDELCDAGMSVKLAKDLDHLGKICRELHEIGMGLRMVPVRPVFQKMARLVRDLSRKQNRQVDFVSLGEDTELDKNVVDMVGNPLVHMVRNAMDHGIESDPSARVALGKPALGRIEMRAFHRGGNIYIEIQDDGKGLDRAAIRSKATARGLLREGETISDHDLFNLIFEPGFTTAQRVTDISGRGVGMDVVRRNIEELRGAVEISSEKGKGTTFSIRLPLTLAIIEGVLARVGGEQYIIPTYSVVRLVRPERRDVSQVFDRGEILAFEGQHLPLFRLASLFDVPHAKPRLEEAVVVVVEDEGNKIGLVADELLGQQSIVIKSLGDALQDAEGVAGGAIMSSGNVALILDVAGLVRMARAEDTNVTEAETAPETMEETDETKANAILRGEPAVLAT